MQKRCFWQFRRWIFLICGLGVFVLLLVFSFPTVISPINNPRNYKRFPSKQDVKSIVNVPPPSSYSNSRGITPKTDMNSVVNVPHLAAIQILEAYLPKTDMNGVVNVPPPSSYSNSGGLSSKPGINPIVNVPPPSSYSNSGGLSFKPGINPIVNVPPPSSYSNSGGLSFKQDMNPVVNVPPPSSYSNSGGLSFKPGMNPIVNVPPPSSYSNSGGLSPKTDKNPVLNVPTPSSYSNSGGLSSKPGIDAIVNVTPPSSYSNSGGISPKADMNAVVNVPTPSSYSNSGGLSSKPGINAVVNFPPPIAVNASAPINYSNSRGLSSKTDGQLTKVSSSPPKWERRHQFLDDVAAYKIANDDPLALTISLIIPGVKRIIPVREQPVLQNGDPRPNKKIVVFNHPAWNWLWMGEISLNDCPVVCYLTHDQSQLQSADAVIFYAVNMQQRQPPRPKDQVWIFFTFESPINSFSHSFNSPEWHNQINWTMTYRSDSDIWYPYGRVNRRRDPLSTNYTALAEKKTEKVAWFVSHCTSPSRREEYVRLLQQFIKVDIYGNCGDRKCPPEAPECFKLLTDKYKFYLSFENSLCDDYVTEKLFGKMNFSAVIPVVFGRVNYTRYAPPKSFIDVADFDSVASLGNYLNYLDRNLTAYTEYLEWRRYYFIAEKPNPVCEVCMKLTEPEKYRRVYPDIYSWWTNGTCQGPKPFT